MPALTAHAAMSCNRESRLRRLQRFCLHLRPYRVLVEHAGGSSKEYTEMKKLSCAAAIAALVAISAPAHAGWTNIGNVNFDYGIDKDTAYGNFGGPATALQLTARGSDVNCKYVRATFGNGSTANVYQGMLRQGTGVRVDLPGDRRNISKLAFECRSYARAGARVDIAADVDAYRAQWARNPIWAKLWANLMPPPPPASTSGWVPIGTERFVGRGDTSTAFAGWAGHQVTRIALKPLDANAQCGRVSATFGNGNTRNLDLNRGGTALRGQLYKIDLPGDVRSITRLNLACHAIGAPAVKIQIYGDR
jgi:hypothetical protein